MFNPDYKEILTNTTARELSTLPELKDRVFTTLSKFEPSYHFEGDFTACVLVNPMTNLFTVGVSKRSRKDKPNHLRGRIIALNRAIRNAIKKEI